ncbi:MAG: efflux RND transporter periplasmic adaptor subunit [Acidobacteria bacterium]|nr:efflux RND transporter periplasmic adaptor subunit [Acidobacteriota bacterium]MCA1610407.1 efflux RND transporter periplasmic adaptor subunit [Acidobacteriota bacterium]MCA1617405.1 efflux RND transporter periplasmic adaptor subunit [Acidobacteriota bacterium]
MTTPLLLILLAMGPGSPKSVPAGTMYPSHLMVDQEVTVTSRITGVIETIHVERGASVSRGQPLATLDLREFAQDVQQAKEDMELKKAELERARTLSAGGISSKADLDEKRARHAVAVAAWEKAKAIRDYAVIRAPFPGMVTEKSARVGQKVVDVQNIPLFKITAFEPLLARIYLPEKELLNVRRNEAVEVTPVSFPEARTTGTIEFISPTVDAASGTFQVLIRVRRDSGRRVLRPGLAVQVRLPADPNR